MSDFSEWFTGQVDKRSLREIADLVGVRHSTVKAWQFGSSVPTWHSCREIADALKVPREYVRALAGYVDEGRSPESDDGSIELSSIWAQLDEPNRESLLRVAQALHATQLHPAPAKR